MGKQSDMSPRDIYAYAEKLEQRIRSLEARSPFTGTGVHPNGVGGLDSNNFVTDVSGFRLNGQTGTPEFNNLKLRGGIIGNDALTSPVVPQYVYDYGTNFGVSTTVSHIRRTTITVPAGITAAIVNVTGRVYAVNNTAGLDYLYVQTNVKGYNGLALPLPVSASGGSGFNVSPFSVLLTDLTPGSTFTVDVDAFTAFGAWAANASNTVDVSGAILWFR